MSALDKSLDEILSEKPKRTFRKKTTVPKTRVGKAAAGVAGKTKARPGPKKSIPTGPKSTPASKSVVDASFSTKVIVYGLPKDIKQDAIKDFFASQVGGVSTVALSYNERGQSKGIATIIFKSAANASSAVEKYNGAPIDGKGKLKLELIVDPTKKPLASRIIANAISKPVQEKKQGGPAKAQPAKKPVKKTNNNKPRNKRPAKKSIEQLDQEMNDYFEKKE
ncbi:hypothetical protein WICMUC_002978 [Wickerhamomyces mucosus]|uniref:RRM domain-containing protein n=1 Tax=Wickerhamomyces mucosus TaxID=1378264 RepID=A0A9P8PNS2_9ASCO|nr:hypothetical protein WICMUC_002978 [Wickerhamomyces mucosus]